MAESDTRRWFLRSPSDEISNNNIPTAMLVQWARQGIIKPGYTLSSDGETWVPAEQLPELEMSWFLLAPGHAPYGPLNRAAAELILAQHNLPPETLLTQNPGEEPATNELPLAITQSARTHTQEVEELRQRLILLERELRVKDRRIDELRQEAEAHQSELNMEGAPDLPTLTRELEALRLQYAHLQSSTQEAAEGAARRERELRQRLHTLETALETAQQAAPAAAPAEAPTAALQELLQRQIARFRQNQTEEERHLDALRELTRQRLAQHADILIALQRLAGEAPVAARTKGPADALAQPAPAAPSASPDLEQALAEARQRESALQRQLVANEGIQAQLRAEITQAERRVKDTLQLDAALQETVAALERERAARQEEHRENTHIQAQLLHRIEELERLATQNGAGALLQNAPLQPPSIGRSSFGWLRGKQ